MPSMEDYLDRAAAGHFTAFDVYLLRLFRAVVFGGAAVFASAIQAHAPLDSWRIGLLVFLFALSNRGIWLAMLALAWLLILCLVPPELAGQIGMWIKSARP